MTSLFLFLICILTLFVILSVGFKPKTNHIKLYTMCISILVVTLFFGLKPKGYRFINQVKWLKQGNGIAFTNIGMIYSEKTLGTIGITDSIVISADILPHSNRQFGRLVTIVKKNGDEIFYINQWKNNLFVSLHGEENKPPVVAFLPNALSGDTIHRVTIGIGRESVWLESDKVKKVSIKRHSAQPSRFLENCSLLIGYDASGKDPWNGELYRLTLSNGCFRNAIDSSFLAGTGTTEVLKHICNDPVAEFSFAKTSNRRIINLRSDTWNLVMPLFPKIFRYSLPQPLTSIFPLSKYLNRNALIDTIVNLLGFIPLGGVFFLLFSTLCQTRKMAFLFTFLIALLTSSSIEFLQILIPTRTSQVIDIVLNVTGACIGAFSVLFSKWFYRLKKGSEEILTPGP